ncbi:DUF4013 domain-containing protein [Candidatus Woesearchaeota archaeon]|nr:DUF4013 domain-containing protein [Candidatus Woesearchaeota archaeon]
MAKKQDTEDFGESLKQGLLYPWNKADRLWNVLWMLIPIFGMFAIVGYAKKITRALIKGQRKELPAFGSFWNNFKEGIIVVIFLIPTFVVLGLLNVIPIIGALAGTLANIFLIPWLVMNFFMNNTFGSLWEIKKAFNLVFNNATEYIMAYIKTLIYMLVYGLLSIVLVGIPCYMFGGFYFLTEFYNKHH